MDAFATEMMWVGIWLVSGFVFGVIATMGMLLNRVDARARSLSQTAHEAAKISRRDRETTPADYPVIRPVSATPSDGLGD